MKSILTILFSFVFLVSGLSQTRNVVVGTNDVIVQPTNFWSANASNGRTGLGLGSAATNPASAFQPSSTVLSNLSLNNASSLTNIQASNIVGVLSITSPTVNFTSIVGTLSIAQGGTGATNAANARQNLGSTTVGDALFIATNTASARTTLGATTVGNSVFTAVDAAAARTALSLGTASTNPASAFQPSSSILSNLVSSNLAVAYGGTGATNAGGARTNLGLDWSALTNTNAATSLLGFTTNGQVIANTGTNVLSFTNNAINIKSIADTGVTVFDVINSTFYTAVTFTENVELEKPLSFFGTNATETAATTRTNLGLGWSALTNSNAGTGLVSVNINGEVVSPTNFWQVAPIQTVVQNLAPITNSTNAATNARNLYVYSLATNITGVTNTVTLPTNTSTFAGDSATIIHQGPTSSVTAVRQVGAGSNLITINRFDESVKFIYENSGWTTYHNISFQEPIYFSGTNASANAAVSRTNLGLGATWLTNTNVTNFRTAVGLGATDTVTFQDGFFNFLTVNEDAFFAYAEFSSGTNSVQLSPSGVVFVGNAAATTRTNLGIPLAALTNTNVTNFRTAIGLGVTNDVQFNKLTVGGAAITFGETIGGGISIGGQGTANIVTVEGGGMFLNLSNYGYGFGTNNPQGAGITRTNLGLPLAALTNTSVTNFQKAIFYTNTAPSNIGGNLGTIAAWIEIVASNGVTYKVPAYTNVP